MAGFELDVKLDKQKVEKWLTQLSNNSINSATTRAINKTLITVRNEAAPAVLKEMGDFGLSNAALKREMKIKKASRRNQIGIIMVSGKRIPLIKFKARKIKMGVRVKVKGSTHTLKHAFIQTMKSGHKGVYLRKDTKTRQRKRLGRTGPVYKELRIKELFGPSIPSEFGTDALQKRFKYLAEKHWPARFTQEINYELSKIK